MRTEVFPDDQTLQVLAMRCLRGKWKGALSGECSWANCYFWTQLPCDVLLAI